MKKNVLFMILVLLMVTIVGCSIASNDDVSSPGGDSDLQSVFNDGDSPQNDFANSADNIYKSYKEAYRYYIYDPTDTSIDFSVYKGSFDDPSALIGDRQYIAIIDGALVY